MALELEILFMGFSPGLDKFQVSGTSLAKTCQFLIILSTWH